MINWLKNWSVQRDIESVKCKRLAKINKASLYGIEDIIYYGDYSNKSTLKPTVVYDTDEGCFVFTIKIERDGGSIVKIKNKVSRKGKLIEHNATKVW